MAESSVSLAQDEFSCSVCLDLLKDPVTIPCGHSYCMSCISGCWDQDDQKRVYSCPQCRQTFNPRPALGKNTMLAEVVEKLKKRKLQAAHPSKCYSESGDVECDVCTGDKTKAIKSCLVCLNSYCQNHLEQHETFFRGKKHNLMDATGRLQEMICSQHEKLLEIFCRTDQCCICYLCTMDEHKNHDTVSAAAESTEKHRQLEETQRKFRKRIQNRRKKLNELTEAVESHKRSAQAAVEGTERNFTELIHFIERRRSEVTQLIRDQEKAAVSQAEGQLDRLKKEIAGLKRRNTELEQLSHTDHHIHFLQSFQSLSVPPGSTELSSITVSSRLSFDDVSKSVSHLREKMERFCREEIKKISDRAKPLPTPPNPFTLYPAPVTSQQMFAVKPLHTPPNAFSLNPAPVTSHQMFAGASLSLSLCCKMAESSISVAQDQFSCSICLDLLKDPVAIPCGHSYCMSCISGCWDQDDQKGVYSCPQCRQTFNPRPALGKNTMLAEVVEKLKKTKLQAARPAQCYSESGDVECDVCTGDKNKAIKSCLVCLNSYCQNHLEQHATFFRGKKHNLMDATGRLQEMICSQHEKLLEIFCRTDQCCICYLCTMDEHKNHDTVSAAAERTEKQSQLGEMKRTNQQIIQEKQKELEELREAVDSHKRSAQAAVEDTERIFSELICSIEKSRSEVTQLIRDQEKAAVSRAEGLLEQLEKEIDDLRKRDAELEQLSHTDHHITFLQSFQSLSVPPGPTDSSSITASSLLFFDDVSKSVSRLKEKLEHFCREEIEMIPDRVRTPEPKTRQEFLRYSCQLTLDPNTVNEFLVLSKGNRVIKYTHKGQLYPDHPDRFDWLVQVLCKERVCGRCYWEVEWSGAVEISVSYKSISRKGRESEYRFGYNDQSWCLSCSDSWCSFWHNNKYTKLPVVSSASRIGVYVDHSAGTLSFYSVSDTMRLIHLVHITFIQPLYPGFGINEMDLAFSKSNPKIKLCDLKI